MHHKKELVECFFMAAVLTASLILPRLAAGQDNNPRQDLFLGNPHEGIVIERRDSGDLIMQAVPPPSRESPEGNGTWEGEESADKVLVIPVPVKP